MKQDSLRAEGKSQTSMFSASHTDFTNEFIRNERMWKCSPLCYPAPVGLYLAHSCPSSPALRTATLTSPKAPL